MARGFLGRLFGRRAADGPPPLTVDTLVEAVFSGGALPAVSVRRLPEAEIPALLHSLGGGIHTTWVGESDQPTLSILYPETWLKNAGSAPGAGRALIASLETAPARLAALEPGSVEGVPPRLAPVVHVSLRFDEADRSVLGFRAHDCTAWILQTPEPGPVVLMLTQREDRLRVALAADAQTTAAIRELVLPEATAAQPVAATAALTLRSPRELVAASLFLPPRVACGNHVVQTRFHRVALGTTRRATPVPGGIWLTAGCTLAGQSWRYTLFFRVDDPARAQALAPTLKQLVACEVRETLKLLGGLPRAAPEKPGVAPASPPDAARLASYLLLEGTVAVSGLLIPAEVWLPAASLAAVAALVLDSADWAQLKTEKPALLAALLAVNHVLLRKAAGRLDREILETRGASTEPVVFPFAAFLELAPDRDVRLAIQNYVLAELGTSTLRSLFCHTETGTTKDGKQVRRTVTPYAVDEARLVSFLPRQAAADWKTLPPNALDRAGWLELNIRILKGIRAAVRRKQLLLSQRARFLLDTLFYPTVQAQTRAKVEALTKGRVPFSEIEKLPRPRIQELLNRTPGRTLALALMGATADRELVRANTSRAKADDLEQDMEGLKRQAEEGTLELEEVLEAKLAMAEEAKRTFETDAERERRTGGKGDQPARAGAGKTATGPRAIPRMSTPARR